MAAKQRPLRADAQQNRERVLEVAREVFAHGLDAPIDDIAQRAGVGIGTVYRHFPNKEALFEAIVIHSLEHFLDDTKPLETSGDPSQAFMDFVDKYLVAGAAKRSFMKALNKSGLPTKRGPMQKMFDGIRESLAVILARAQKAKVIRADVGPEEVLALLRGISAANDGYDGESKDRALLRTVVLDGLRRK